MFIGEYNHSVDAKGRLSIPNKFRKELGDSAIITRGLDESLFVFTKDEWDKLVAKLAQLPMTQSNTRAFVRLMLAGAMDVSVDTHGRVMIPEYLRSYAGINKSVTVAGLFSRLEIWDSARWDVYKKETEKDASHIAEQLGELGI
ncbi:MAG: hypothetical protein ACD_76C00027G0006 [uncultured bacterium]|nr:MAG: hypothetical protein ACD_76C00027G0006 [uncultured bacterium]HBD05232.1 cell division/cell wall cluster transcriptional repressor MraZ [Candidatus Uhrbacteria bacterium]